MPHAPAPSTTYQRLRHYIAKRMRISHIYQPLMLMELLGRSSPAPAQDVARRGLGEDVTQIEYYTERVKRIVGRVLTGNGITAYGDGHRSPISGSVNYRVHRCAQGRCECCGAHEHQRALEVDHIIPRNQGGSDDITNLQALCFRCNAGKRDTDCTDFRRVQASYGHREAGCVLRALEGSGRVLLENEGHSLVIPRRHGADGLELHQPEWNAVVELLKLRREQLSAQDATISGSAGWFAQRQRGAELRRGSGAVGVSCALASDSEANR